MRKLILCCLMMSCSWSALADVKQGQVFKVARDITFFDVDYTGILSGINLFTSNPVLQEGHLFEVQEVHQRCSSKKIHGKSFRTCKRTMRLVSDGCGHRELRSVERREGPDFTLYLRAKAGFCSLTVMESDNDAGIMRKTSEKLLAQRSRFNYFFE